MGVRQHYRMSDEMVTWSFVAAMSMKSMTISQECTHATHQHPHQCSFSFGIYW